MKKSLKQLFCVFSILVMCLTLLCATGCKKTKETNSKDAETLSFATNIAECLAEPTESVAQPTVKKCAVETQTNEEFERYAHVVSSIFNSSKPKINVVKSDNKDYEFKVDCTTTDYYGKEETYSIYYNKEYEKETDGKEIEEAYKISAVAVFENKTYEILAETSNESEVKPDGAETEIELDVTIKLDQILAIKVEQEIENDEVEYCISQLFDETVLYSFSFEYEVKDGKTTKVSIIQTIGELRFRYAFTKEETSDELIFNFTGDGITSLANGKITINKQTRRVEVTFTSAEK